MDYSHLELNKSNKNVSIEFIRIVGCLLVIMAHSQLELIVDGGRSFGRVLSSTIISDNVPLFLLISGFLLFGKADSDFSELGFYNRYLYRIKSFVRKIYIPSLLYIIFICAFNSIKEGGFSTSALLNADWKKLFNFIFNLSANDHLWYVCTYTLVIFFYPIFDYLCNSNRYISVIRRVVLVGFVIDSLIKDIQYIGGNNILNRDRTIYCFAYILLGYELYQCISKAKNKWILLLIGMLLYFGGIFIKMIAQSYIYQNYGWLDNAFICLQSSLSLMTAVGLFLIIYIVAGTIKNGSLCSKIIFTVGNKSFYVYLLHYIIVSNTGFIRKQILSVTSNAVRFSTCVVYYFVYALFIFCVTYIVTVLLNLLYRLLLKIYLFLFFNKSNAVS